MATDSPVLMTCSTPHPAQVISSVEGLREDCTCGSITIGLTTCPCTKNTDVRHANTFIHTGRVARSIRERLKGEPSICPLQRRRQPPLLLSLRQHRPKRLPPCQCKECPASSARLNSNDPPSSTIRIVQAGTASLPWRVWGIIGGYTKNCGV